GFDFIFSNDINDIERAIWELLVDGAGATSYAVGVGADVDPSDDDLEDVAHPDGPNNPFILTDVDGLLSTLPGYTPPFLGATGNVVTNDNFGAEGFGGIVSIVVPEDSGSFAYKFDKASNQIQKYDGDAPAGVPQSGSILAVLTDKGATLEFNFLTGQWKY